MFYITSMGFGRYRRSVFFLLSYSGCIVCSHDNPIYVNDYEKRKEMIKNLETTWTYSFKV